MLLEAGREVVVLDRFFFGWESLKDVFDRVRIVRDDIRWCDPSVFAGVDCVMDLASLSNDPSGELNAEKTMEINYRGRVRVANLAKKQGIRKYILASTCSVYGSSEGISDETSALNPLNTNARAKALAEQEILALNDRSFCTTVLRQATVYGLSNRMRFDLAINGMVMSFHKTGKLKVMRDGTQWRPFVHVKDTSETFITALEADSDVVGRKVFNVGSNDQNFQILGLAQTVAEAIGVPFDYEWYGSPDTRNYRVSFDKIEKELRFKPRYTPREGAREIYDALRSGELDSDNPKFITVEWYKKLLSNPELSRQVELNGVII